MYAMFAQTIRTGQAAIRLPTFDTAIEMHRLLDIMRAASDSGRILPFNAQ